MTETFAPGLSGFLFAPVGNGLDNRPEDIIATRQRLSRLKKRLPFDEKRPEEIEKDDTPLSDPPDG